MVAMRHEKTCIQYGDTFTSARADASYCSDRCRSRRARKRTTTDAAHDDLIRARDAINQLLTTLDQNGTKA